MEPKAKDRMLRTLLIVAVFLAAAGAVAGRLVTAADQAAKQVPASFIGTPPAAGATEGNPVDFTYGAAP